MAQDLTEPEMDALLDVLEHDSLAAYGSEDPGWWTWDCPGLQWMKQPLYRTRRYIKTWKELHG